MKKIVLAVAAVAALATPVIVTSSSVGADPNNSTLHCTNFDTHNRCSATDPDFLNYIRIVNPDTGEVLKTVTLSCADQETKHGFNWDDVEGRDHYRIWVADCSNNSDKYSITVGQVSQP